MCRANLMSSFGCSISSSIKTYTHVVGVNFVLAFDPACMGRLQPGGDDDFADVPATPCVQDSQDLLVPSNHLVPSDDDYFVLHQPVVGSQPCQPASPPRLPLTASSS
eukprot:TRINITY_DN2134_c0_g1_i1.p1 TRINITY_DN2134_c0_g1~~TRINITY_DN2134_c0_g1_i1.p1  ORF type:complete len:107 (-),score=12.16 TRINITY_DN2134_c0_g1_i1:307-627(-)